MSFDGGRWEDEAAYDKREECDYCGKCDLEWVEVDENKWRLCDQDTGKIHNCLQTKASVDDFEDLTEEKK